MDSLTLTLAALSDPTRRNLLRHLTRGAASVRELAEPFAMTQQAISKHLAVLERARLIIKRPEGRRNVCSINAAPVAEVVSWALGFREYWEQSYERLDELLARTPPPRSQPSRHAK